jgi:penicillin-binding protein 1C
VGFDGKRTIGVWVGRADGAPVPGLNGRATAAPILFDAFARTGKLPAPLPPMPAGALVATTAKLPPPLQRLHAGALTVAGSEPQLRIVFPPHGARLELATGESGKPDPIALKVAGGSGALTVLVNGMPVPAAPGRRTLFFEPEGPGFVRLTVMDGAGASDSVVVRLQ